MELIGNVYFKSDFLELKNADRILYNQAKKEILVFGLKDFTFNGAIQVSGKPNKNILRYKIGEAIAYLE